MKVLIIGADGFLGRNLLRVIRNDPSLEVVSAGRGESNEHNIDLLSRDSIRSVLSAINPNVIVNCAGIVKNSEEAYKNGEFCRHIFEEILALGKPYPRVILSGSAAEYGVVEDINKAVSEDFPLRATSHYGKSKIEEEKIALEYAHTYGIEVVIARIFNPIGPGMGEKFLLTSLLKQLEGVRTGEMHTIAISRGDSMRDYVDVRDVADAIHKIIVANKNMRGAVYNIGSGRSISNRELTEAFLKHVELSSKPTIIETQDTPEQKYAAKADIGLIELELGWRPKYSLEDSVEDIVSAQSHK